MSINDKILLRLNLSVIVMYMRSYGSGADHIVYYRCFSSSVCGWRVRYFDNNY